jgi:nucleotide-binding universal stress UspA family protein
MSPLKVGTSHQFRYSIVSVVAGLSVQDWLPDTLISMCSHGWSGVTRWLLGSVAETVVRHSDNPVLILRPSLSDQG